MVLIKQKECSYRFAGVKRALGSIIERFSVVKLSIMSLA